MQSLSRTIVVIGTGGTIAGESVNPADNVGYVAAMLTVDTLLKGVPALAGLPIEAEQVAQVDSKDMDGDVWQRLAQACSRHLARDEVAGIVVTHGTDTLEETAWFLQRTLAPSKPLVLTAAMRPATSLQADGPQNLLDAVTVARQPGPFGVCAVIAGKVHAARDVRKVHTYAIDAYSSGDAGPAGVVEEGAVTWWRQCCATDPALPQLLHRPLPAWPWVEIVFSHAAVRRDAVDAIVAKGVQGIVVAGTGNGTVHQTLEASLEDATAAGVTVWRATRCSAGRVLPIAGDVWPGTDDLTPVKARVELMLHLAIRDHGRD